MNCPLSGVIRVTLIIIIITDLYSAFRLPAERSKIEDKNMPKSSSGGNFVRRPNSVLFRR